MRFMRKYRESRGIKAIVLAVSIAVLGTAIYGLLVPIMVTGAVIAGLVSGIWLLCESRMFRRFCRLIFRNTGQLLRGVFRLAAPVVGSILWRRRRRAGSPGC